MLACLYSCGAKNAIHRNIHSWDRLYDKGHSIQVRIARVAHRHRTNAHQTAKCSRPMPQGNLALPPGANSTSLLHSAAGMNQRDIATASPCAGVVPSSRHRFAAHRWPHCPPSQITSSTCSNPGAIYDHGFRVKCMSGLEGGFDPHTRPKSRPGSGISLRVRVRVDGQG